MIFPIPGCFVIVDKNVDGLLFVEERFDVPFRDVVQIVDLTENGSFGELLRDLPHLLSGLLQNLVGLFTTLKIKC